mmetsp:Transcript_1687/g.3225  ORF Transcript_1687/g.3225 Transcript_1687/m.3225 type:complete len:235 (+) Transcript_1687:876-1580(+)
MHAGAGGLPDGVQPTHGGLAIQVGEDAAHPVVRSGGNRDALGVHVDAPGAAELDEVRKAVLDLVARQVPQVQIHARSAGRLQVEEDGPAHRAARRKLTCRVVVEHKATTLLVDDVRAFSPHGLGDQGGGCSFAAEGGGVELHKLEIAEQGAGSPADGGAVAGYGSWVGRRVVHLPAAARSHNDRPRWRKHQLAFVEQHSPAATVLLVEGNVQHHSVVNHSNVGSSQYLLLQRPH